MKKDLIFVGIHEFRRVENFLFPVGELIQIPLSEKTTVRGVFDQLDKRLEDDALGEDAMRKFHRDVGRFDPHQKFFDYCFFIPEPGVLLHAVYSLRTVY